MLLQFFKSVSLFKLKISEKYEKPMVTIEKPIKFYARLDLCEAKVFLFFVYECHVLSLIHIFKIGTKNLVQLAYDFGANISNIYNIHQRINIVL